MGLGFGSDDVDSDPDWRGEPESWVMNQDHVLSSGSRPSIHAAGPHGTFVARLSTPASANEYCASMQHGDLSSSNAELQCDLGGEETQLVGVEDRPLVLYE